MLPSRCKSIHAARTGFSQVLFFTSFLFQEKMFFG
jgi:hypothetical protein